MISTYMNSNLICTFNVLRIGRCVGRRDFDKGYLVGRDEHDSLCRPTGTHLGFHAGTRHLVAEE